METVLFNSKSSVYILFSLPEKQQQYTLPLAVNPLLVGRLHFCRRDRKKEDVFNVGPEWQV